MNKLHLVAVVPNEGARRLAAWILRTAGASVATVASSTGIEATMIDRILSGDVVPASDMAHRLWLVTEGDIDRHDWRSAPVGGWFDAVPSRLSKAAA